MSGPKPFQLQLVPGPHGRNLRDLPGAVLGSKCKQQALLPHITCRFNSVRPSCILRELLFSVMLSDPARGLRIAIRSTSIPRGWYKQLATPLPEPFRSPMPVNCLTLSVRNPRPFGQRTCSNPNESTISSQNPAAAKGAHGWSRAGWRPPERFKGQESKVSELYKE